MSLSLTRRLAEIRTYRLPDNKRMRYVLSHSHGLLIVTLKVDSGSRPSLLVSSSLVSTTPKFAGFFNSGVTQGEEDIGQFITAVPKVYIYVCQFGDFY